MGKKPCCRGNIAPKNKKRECLCEDCKLFRRAKAANRFARKVAHKPIWADEEKIHEIYMDSATKTYETGVQYAVDHIIPVFGVDRFGITIVSGLHVPWNLQVITHDENMTKGHRMGDYAFTKPSFPAKARLDIPKRRSRQHIDWKLYGPFVKTLCPRNRSV